MMMMMTTPMTINKTMTNNSDSNYNLRIFFLPYSQFYSIQETSEEGFLQFK
jgi:hypothetical protein